MGLSLWTRHRVLLAFLWIAPALSCAGETEQDPAAAAAEPGAAEASPSPAPDPLDSAVWNIGVTSVPDRLDAGSPLPILTALRTGTHPDHERVTVEIGPDASGPPGYQVEYIDRPLMECGSGRQIYPVGDAWLELRLEPAAAHTEAGQPTLGAREVQLDGPLLLRVYRTCDFEGIVTLVLALASPNPYRVATLTDPLRIVVDVQR